LARRNLALEKCASLGGVVCNWDLAPPCLHLNLVGDVCGELISLRKEEPFDVSDHVDEEAERPLGHHQLLGRLASAVQTLEVEPSLSRLVQEVL